MNIELKTYADAGILDKERLSMNVLEDTDIGDYVVLRSSVQSNGAGPTSGFKTAFWFPDANVKKGDTVILYTKAGQASTKPKAGGGTVHFFYWGRANAYWSKEHRSVAVLLEAPTWTSLAREEPEDWP